MSCQPVKEPSPTNALLCEHPGRTFGGILVTHSATNPHVVSNRIHVLISADISEDPTFLFQLCYKSLDTMPAIFS